MGIETILVVGLLIVVIGVFVGLGRAKRRATRTHTGNAPKSSPGPR